MHFSIGVLQVYELIFCYFMHLTILVLQIHKLILIVQ